MKAIFSWALVAIFAGIAHAVKEKQWFEGFPVSPEHFVRTLLEKGRDLQGGGQLAELPDACPEVISIAILQVPGTVITEELVDGILAQIDAKELALCMANFIFSVDANCDASQIPSIPVTLKCMGSFLSDIILDFGSNDWENLMKSKLIAQDLGSDCDAEAVEPETDLEECIVSLGPTGCFVLADEDDVISLLTDDGLNQQANCVYQRALAISAAASGAPNPFFSPAFLFGTPTPLMQNCSQVEGMEEFYAPFGASFPPTASPSSASENKIMAALSSTVLAVLGYLIA